MSIRSIRALAVLVVLPIVLLLLSGLFSSTVRASTSTIKHVANTNNSGVGSLRDAIGSASFGDTIIFDPSVVGTIYLSPTNIFIGIDLTISGPGASVLSISGSNNNGVFNVASANVTISGLTIRNGSASTGAGIINSGIFGVLTITQCVIQYNMATTGAGGGIANSGNLVIDNSRIDDNYAFASNGGGLYSAAGSVTLINVTIDSNQAGMGGGVSLESTQAQLISSHVLTNTSITSGGGIYIDANSTLDLEYSRIANNTAGNSAIGGGIFNVGETDLFYTTIISNGTGTSGAGGGLGNSGILNLTRSSVLSNTAEADGGGILNVSPGVVDLYYSTLAYNVANGTAGGILNSNAIVTATDSTLSGNQAYGLFNNGAAIRNVGVGKIWLYYDTISYNNGGSNGGLSIEGSSVITAVGTIIAGNSGATNPDCSGNLNSLGHNLITVDTGCTINGTITGNIIGIDPQLLSLQDNGGSTWTLALQSTSPAIDAGSASYCPSYDQRGIHRPIDGNHDGVATCDIGAYEVQIYVYLPLVAKNS
ncbi:MAG TPA: choice-of-anchor Q domain-containing protein [Anaerolineae bacterium]|nr:choice-of-anchor Q domain-containing protein [Anaerolineae bacterium]